MNVVEIINNTDNTLDEVQDDVKTIENSAKTIMDICDGLLGKEK